MTDTERDVLAALVVLAPPGNPATRIADVAELSDRSLASLRATLGNLKHLGFAAAQEGWDYTQGRRITFWRSTEVGAYRLLKEALPQ